MFTTHFKMTMTPFQEYTPTEMILRDERISQGLARLEYMTRHGAIALVTGQTGAGKSCLLKLFKQSLPANSFLPVYLPLTSLSSTGLLRLIVTTLGEPPARSKDRIFLQIINGARKLERTPVLILDEAHLINHDALTDFRLLMSSSIDNGPPLKLILAGQEQLRNTLKQTRHLDLLHRVSVAYHIKPLSTAQTAAFIDFQMTKSGTSDKVFEPEVKTAIHEYTHGIPRQINSIATACLINAATRNSQKITEPILMDTLEELHML